MDDPVELENTKTQAQKRDCQMRLFGDSDVLAITSPKHEGRGGGLWSFPRRDHGLAVVQRVEVNGVGTSSPGHR